MEGRSLEELDKQKEVLLQEQKGIVTENKTVEKQEQTETPESQKESVILQKPIAADLDLDKKAENAAEKEATEAYKE